MSTFRRPFKLNPVEGNGHRYYVVTDADGKIMAQGAEEMCKRVAEEGPLYAEQEDA